MIRPLLLEASQAPRPSLPARARAFFTAALARPHRGRGLRPPAARRPAVPRGPGLPEVPDACRRAVVLLAVPGVARLARAALAGRPPAVAHPHQADRLVPVHRPGPGRAADAVHGRRRRPAARPHGLARVVTAEVERTGDVLLATARAALAGLPAATPRRRARCRPGSRPRARCTPASASRCCARDASSPALATAPAVAAGLAGKGPSFKGLVPREREDELRRTRCCARCGRRGAPRCWSRCRSTPPSWPRSSGGPRSTCSSAARCRSRCATSRRPQARRADVRAPARAADRDRGGRPQAHAAGTRRACCSWPCRTGPPGRPARRARSRARPWPIQYDPLLLVRRLAPIQLPKDASGRSVPDLLLYALGIVGSVFVVMYGVALALGLMLARSITRGVHALSVGTQKLREGDFAHVIKLRSRDQLGELAASFNLMSRGIQQLMREQAEKERLEEELRIARQIQMSLLPGEGLVSVPGIRIAALVPAGGRGGRRLLRPAAARPDADGRAGGRRLGQGHLGRALHGRAQGPGAVAVAHLRVARAAAVPRPTAS